MDWKTLYKMQKQLDSRIKLEHDLKNNDVVEDKILALLVELGELANETRCFKFWSNKGPNEQQVILEEYVDGLHFILSIGIEKGYYYEYKFQRDATPASLTAIFLRIYNTVVMLQHDPSEEVYKKVVDIFMDLGHALGFSEEMIERAYIEKNEVNHVRQDQGY